MELSPGVVPFFLLYSRRELILNKKDMKKSYIVIGVIIVIVLGIFLWFKGSYNQMVGRSEAVSAQWSNVENQYQRRADLIPNLVNTVKGYAEHEKTTLAEVVEARAKATQMQVNFDNLDAQTIQKFNAVQGELSSALSRLMVSVERYPDLKANENFRDLQAQLEGTENRIAVERRKFNEEVQSYNKYIRFFPQNIVAGMFGFSSKPYFEAAEGTEKAPEVKF